jgi:hypothetical protein
MGKHQARTEFVREAVSHLMGNLTEAAVGRFGETAYHFARTVEPLKAPPGWRDYDFIEVLLLQAVPWMRTMMATFGCEQVKELVADRMGKMMHEFGQRASADCDGTVAGLVERSLAPIPPGALTIEQRRIDGDRVEFKVTQCR